MLTDEDLLLIDQVLAVAHYLPDDNYHQDHKISLTISTQSARIESNNAGPSEPERIDMPYLKPGEKLNTGFSQFHKLKEVNDKIRIRIAGIPYVEGKHFFQTPEGWDVKPCPRINEGVNCTYCQVYFDALTAAKKTGDDKKVAAVKQDAKMKPYKCSLIVYYPVLNRTEGKAEIFQTVMSVREAIEAEAAMGTDTTKTDFIVLCTNGVGNNKYKVSKVDSTDNPPLELEEVEELNKAKSMKLDELVAGSADSDSEVGQQAQNAEVEV